MGTKENGRTVSGDRVVREEEEQKYFDTTPDDWHSDGSPIFNVDDDDYHLGVQRDPKKRWKFHDSRINSAARNAKYRKGLTFWLVNKRNGKKYKFINPTSASDVEKEKEKK